ncbi:GntR family transcriptional regulator/MocR family aminotransferase [Prauserella rugosa]|uniref:GntR family transcriptional regulator/MocR family aminotransferase n=2 Tax=Prauserella rugosa TaxID=43354 RepID=A0A660CNI6_9PSEU|nr:GntR family transcriptional regulator/MocR family aminotransferase [Prauserella rugosa]
MPRGEVMPRGDTALPVTLDRASAVPLAVQLADALRESASSGHLRGGDRLPSTRALADRLGVSRTVTAAAYEQLHAEGWIVGKHGSGTYVTTSPPTARPEHRSAAARDELPPGRLALLPGVPWAEGLDRSAWRRAWRAASDTPPAVYLSRTGLAEYREVIAEHLLRHRGLDADTESVLATGGTTAAVVELAAAVLRPGDLVAVEEPGYQRAVQAFVRAGMRVVGVPIDGEGLRTDLVPPGARLVYCSPAHQYPMGCRMSASRRVELTELARRRDMLVVEDDYDGELRYDVAPLPLLASLAPDVVVHLGTTSKILTPTLGAGWMVAPPPVTQAVLEHRELTGTRPSPAGQHVVVELARHGDLGRHLRRLRRELSDRRTILVEAFARAGVRVLGDDAGAHLVVPLATAEGERETIAAGKRSGVLLDGLARHFASTPTAHGVLVGYAGCSRTELAECVPTLVELSRNGPR